MTIHIENVGGGGGGGGEPVIPTGTSAQFWRGDKTWQLVPDTGTGGTNCPVDATYITQTASGTLTNEQVLAELNTGLLYVTSGTGVLTNPTSFSITGTATCPTIKSAETVSGTNVTANVSTVTTTITTATIKSTETISGTNISGAFTGTTLNISGTTTSVTLKNTNLISGTNISGSFTGTALNISGTSTLLTIKSTETISGSNITAATITPLTLIAPNSNNPTLTLAGQISVDTSTTSNAQMRFYADAEYALPAYQSKSFVIVSPTTASDYIVWKVPYDITLKNYYVQCNGADNVIGALDIANGKGVTATATSADVTSWNGSSTAATILNSVVNAGSYVNWHTTSISSTPLSVNISFDYIANTTVL